MQLLHLVYDSVGQRYVAQTDAGNFSVPAVAGGWAQRTLYLKQGRVSFSPVDVQRAAQFLGMVATRFGCGCLGRRK